MHRDDEEALLRSVAIQNAQSILAARQRSEQEMLKAKEALEHKTQELSRALATMQATLESTWDGTLAVDERGTVTAFNQTFVGMWRLSATIMESRDHQRIIAFVAPQLRDPQVFVERVQAIYATSPEESSDVLEFTDGRVFERYSRIQTVDGRNVGRVWTFRDVTERRRAEDALRHAMQAAEAASHAKDEFLAMLGHELRNPLGAIAGAVGVLTLKGEADNETAQLREIIHRQAAHLARLLDDLLDVTRLATGKIELQYRPVDLKTVAEGALRSLAEGGKAAQHAISFTGQTIWVDGDPPRLEQVIFNLLDNAVKYTPPGGRIIVTTAVEGNFALIRVADTGVGMTEEVMARVFEPFAQARQTLDRARGGLGLGLTLVKRLVELHGGRVTTHSRGLGYGTEVLVQLPLTKARSEPETVPPREAGVGPRRVLIVDDNNDMRSTLRMLLQVGGHQVDEAVDGVEALEVLLRLRPEVAFIDLGLPGRDGYEVAQAVRDAPGGTSLYLVALTGFGQPQDRRRALEVGFNAYLVKPVSLDDLTRVLAAAPADR